MLLGIGLSTLSSRLLVVGAGEGDSADHRALRSGLLLPLTELAARVDLAEIVSNRSKN